MYLCVYVSVLYVYVTHVLTCIWICLRTHRGCRIPGVLLYCCLPTPLKQGRSIDLKLGSWPTIHDDSTDSAFHGGGDTDWYAHPWLISVGTRF